jgi:hypothetical protein
MSYTYEEVRRQLLDMIATIQRDYQRQIQPYVEQLARLEASRPLSPMLIRCQELLPAILAQVTPDEERDATSAQLAEERRFPHRAAAVTGLTQQDYDALVRDAMLWRTRSPTGAGGTCVCNPPTRSN